MKREFLTNLGITDKEVIDKILDNAGGEINDLKTQIEQFKANEQTLKDQITERDKQLKDVGKDVKDNEELSKKIKDLEEANKQAQADYENKLLVMKKEQAIDNALREAKAKNIVAVKALLKTDDITFSNDNQVIGLKEQLDKLQKEENTSFLFGVESIPKPTGTEPAPTPNSNNQQPKPSGNILAKAVADYFKTE